MSIPALLAPDERRTGTRRLVVALVVLLLLSLTGLPTLAGRPGSFVAELGLVVVGALLTLRVARQWLVVPGLKVLGVVSAFVALIAVGQIVREKRFFPWMPYTMYGRPAEGPVNIYEYQAHYRSGRRERFRPSLVIATLARARIVKGLARRLDTLSELPAEQRDSARERAEVEAALSVLVASENRARVRDPITQIEIVKVVLPAPYAPSSPQRRTIMTVNMNTQAAP